MAVFRRARASQEEPAQDEPTTTDGGAVEDPQGDVDATEAGSDRGPWDVESRPDRGSRVDLGAIWLPGVDGMQLRLEATAQGGTVTSATVTIDGSSLQVQAFAAPRSAGIWDEIRAEIGESVTKQGGSVDDLPGPFGRELLARLPVRTSEGRTGHRPARFIGADGPRWFLRGVVTGRAAVDPEAARTLEDVFADIVVVRGSEARAPRELLPLTAPGTRSAQPEEQQNLLDPFKRGPEITEVH
ncbi:DUF3710 domain-containing protein [Actinotalea sp. M2MS4P-6]|uniref:DUF3710 domain-containing protein n=1 Tax=Actinotalea sp. M2MS4P-6 TaxID=2983762 RepID=UPI0021E3F71A|nr:DUF3710 domain-containing protein [Actinotalea sp. M2MS4P-6]MCV2396343.1 DUF3710 domain-containing protein [Actinotalea sp. M2MS4P-6]